MALAEDDPPDPSGRDVTSWLILSVVQLVLVRYDGLKFRQITPCGAKLMLKSVMHRSDSAWKWPTNPDIIFYEHANICELRGNKTFSGTQLLP